MADSNPQIDVDNLVSLSTTLLDELQPTSTLVHLSHSSDSLLAFCRETSTHLRTSLEEWEERAAELERKVGEVGRETLEDEEVERVGREMIGEVEKERALRVEIRMEEELAEQEKEITLLLEQREELKKEEKDAKRNTELLAMCVSVTNVIPNLKDRRQISGYIVDRNKKRCKKFEYEPSLSPMEICDKLWEMVE